jgi:capsular exopolysaccharide synthesis family protein
MVDAMVLRDPQFVELRDRLAGIEEAILYQSQRSARGPNDPAVKKLQDMRDGLLVRMEQRREELKPQIITQLSMDAAGRRTGAAAESPIVLRMRREIMARQLDEAAKDFDKVADEVKQLGQANADLMARRQEIEQLTKVTDEMGIRLNATEIDIAMPNRVELIEEASVPEGSDDLFRTMLSVLATAAGLVLGGGSVVALEYLRDRLSTADEVPQRIGLRVIGTVPRITRRTNPGHVAERVDGVRAVISQTGREVPKVILVTSAVEHEGKTTFAAQLAASLARAGNRTLIVDGDLRHPNTHLALELDLRSGLPELLRGEIGPDEAVQPTSIDGLFAVTGGSCDYASITALSRPDAAKIVQAFRGSFDAVVIDTGPVLAFADVLLLGQLSDAAIVVTMRDVSRLPLVTKAVDRLRSVGIRVLGTVVNGLAETATHRQYASPLPS